MWKPEYAKRRKQKAEQDPEFRAKRNAQGNGADPDRRAEYMREYREREPAKFKRTPEQQERVNARRRERYAADAEYLERAKASARRSPDERRGELLRSNYDLTSEQYDAMLQAQDGVCAICRRGTSQSRLHVDHCHETGKVRGILCTSCNNGLGRFGDSADRLSRAIEYLIESRR